METKIICPNCGTSFKLPEHESVCVGKTIGKDSNMGIIYLTPEDYRTQRKTYTDKCQMLGEMLGKSHGSESIQAESDKAIDELVKWESTHKIKEEKRMTKAQERIETLKSRGIDVTNYFAINEDTVIKMENGVPTVVPMQDDPIVKQIITDGDVFNARLDGRWVMAQMFHMLNYENRYRRGRGYNDALNDKGYMYQWEMLVGRNHGEWTGELLRLEARERDGEDLSVKQIWFNGDLVSQMILDYIVCLRRYINSLPTYLCKGKLEYKRLGDRYEKLTKKPHGDVFLEDLESVVYDKYRKYAADAKYARNYGKLVGIVKDFKRDMIKPSGYATVKRYFKLSQAFKDAYKGNGAYYTAANLIRFHGCKVNGKYDKAYSMAILDERTREACGWKLLGFLKELIEDNHFDFNARMSELNV